MRQAVVRSSFFGLSTVTWKRSIWHTGVRVIGIDSHTSGFPIRCFAARRSRTSRSSKASLKPKMADESDAFYVVRKGDIVGIYKRLSDCQAQVSSSVCDPSVSVYKGYCLRKETEDYLASQGFKDALYTMHASHLKDDMFGSIVACPFQQPDGLAFLVDKTPKGPSAQKRSQEVGIAGSSDKPTAPTNKFSKTVSSAEGLPINNKTGNAGSSDMPISLSNKLFNLAPNTEAQPGNKLMTCIVEFDGASKGNPGKAGAGAVLRTEDGNVISHVREGLGIATNNVAEYRALILGMKYALMRGFKHIRVQGDSQLVCLQVQELWQTKNQNMADLCKEVKKLRDMFQSFSITHVRREFNAIADNLANLAVSLPVGEICEDFGPVS
ncbi:uncharacterized protein LOC110023808 isoform X1 [Phalaenopsis equestris]|uniref:uncharacterized protein LOC110023808 isoform X1 n=1 Tax=Phalaenopsis equestris TaxID=78828 RepID=UPI0009E3F3C7|nr:uncharacterized protein LOC110023808 isoform X1 [Phalaenopsis equestris]XP_020579064.1 uncharacterized protein LOC110023808 isoform X1 [Phalaenopsis equestris]XP_020579065.1 uncharacterized protein LOC110023808 isoform X1 [Phalaenopsis equestris]XP_020579066.1 uncharacterized protein LOC110023808 isoform X1 [Phalaenopsis equestris]XP_020579067.1 uncharacterized protein LOC110023808 isoform X1 [Phalaenopsis equestris]XP_020579068.1 uncharacterized protein LOC110023808 isoform X1 [Phalaenopsi